MRCKIFFILIIFNLFTLNIKGYEYSSWEDVYPQNINKSFIESEVRYKWYKEDIVDVEYLKRSEFGNKQYDINDFIYGEESSLSMDKIDENEDIVVSSTIVEHTFSENDINYVIFDNFKIYGELYFSEIEIFDVSSNKDVDFEIYETNLNDVSILNDNSTLEYVKISNDFRIVIKLDKTYNVGSLKIEIKYKSSGNGEKRFFHYYSYSEEIDLFYRSINLSICNGCSQAISYLIIYNSTLTHNANMYSYKDKLYKTYNINKLYEGGYHKQLDGYIKDESDSKTYYRYITDSYVMVDVFGNLVHDENYCSKNYCYIEYIKGKEDIINNPKTIDDIELYFILFIVSFVLIVVILFISLFMKKMSKKSSFVEFNKFI